MKKVIVGIIGIVLLVGVIVTGSYGLGEQNIEIFRQAVVLEEEANQLGFDNFSIVNYPVAFYDGDKDYVLTWQDGIVHTKTRKPVFNSVVATAYPVNGHYEVLAPTVEKMSSLLGVMSAGQSEYGLQEQISTIWHEAFHCWQLTNFEGNISGIVTEQTDESVIVEYVDNKEEVISILKQQTELLENAVKSNDIDKLQEYIAKYKELDIERKAMLPANVIALEEYYTRVEGTACYVEACIYESQLPDKFEANYIDTISECNGGSGKYYKIGMAQCMILDMLNPNWKEGYDFSISIMDLIYKELEK